MKIRKALAVVLSLAMTVTLMPATAFASTTNTVEAVQTVQDDDAFSTSVKLSLDQNLEAGEGGTVDITLNKGTFTKFASNEAGDDIEVNEDGSYAYGEVGTVVKKYDNGNALVAGVNAKKGNATVAWLDVTNLTVEVTDISKKSLTLSVKAVGGAVAKDTDITLYLAITADGSDDDEVTVEMDCSGQLSSMNAKTVARIAGGGTTATVEDADTVGRGTGIEGAEVTIKESVANAVGDGVRVLTLTLPKGVEWAPGTKFSGTLLAAPYTLGAFNAQNANYKTSKADVTDTPADKEFYVDGKTLVVALAMDGDSSIKEKLVINPMFDVTKDASKGDIKLKVEADEDIDDASGLVIATYGDANVSIFSKDADKLPEVVAGKEKDKDDDEFVVSITFEENSKDALTSDKYIDLEFNTDSVQLVEGSKVKYYLGDKYAKKDYDDGIVATTALLDTIEGDQDEDTSSFTLTVPSDDNDSNHYLAAWDKADANTLTLFIPVTVSADYVGDITLTAKGNAGIDETTVTVAKAVAPVTVETTVTKVVNGAQSQATANVKITENFAGALKDDKSVTLELDNLGLSGVVFKGDGKATVTAGDIEIKDPKKGQGNATNTISFKIDDESTVASTIEISDLAINLGRILPEGEYNLKVKGDALVENGGYNKDDFSSNAVKTPYINITTAADTAQTGTVANFFLDGSKNSTYTVNGVDATMDAAAYLDSNNRTMVPIRYVAYALGLADTDISYNVGDSTATLSGLTNVVKVTTGSNVLQASNGNVVMDTVAVNNSGRLYVPARFIAQAMGAQVAWDQATKTVTITK